MKIVAGIATMKGREHTLTHTIASLRNQVNRIHVYNNAIERQDYADNGKFFFLKDYEYPVYYFSCDDDLIYPMDYVEKSIKAIEKYQCIVTYHGRKLLGLGLNYYRGHETYRCLGTVEENKIIDVAGTGVSAFRTDYFNPVNIYNSEHKRMADIIFSLEAAKQDKTIMILAHNTGWIKYQDIPPSKTIHGRESKRCETQNRLADQIYTIKYPQRP